MTKGEYTLNSAAWALVGVGLTLTYQIVANWWRGRKGLGKLPPIGAIAYFGSLLVLFAIVTSLFQFSQIIHQDQSEQCQLIINRNNVSVANTRQSNLVQLVQDLSEQLRNQGVSQKQIQIRLNKFVDNANRTGTSIPVSDCDENPNNIPPIPTPSRSP